MNWIYITLIVIASLIGVILIYVLVQIIFDEIKKGYFKKECEKSYYWINKYFGLYSVFVGEIGAGKTTMASGVTNYRTIYKMQQAQSKIEEIKIKYPELDFNRLNDVIDQLYKYGNYEFEHITNAAYISNYILPLQISDKDKRTYEDVFGGPLKYEMSKTDVDYLNVVNQDNHIYYRNKNDELVDEKGFLLTDTFERIPVYSDDLIYERDIDGLIKFDKFMNPIIDHVEKSNEQERELVYVDNYLSYIDGYQMLRDYINAYVALLRNNYVYFVNRKFYSHVTHNYARDYDEKLLDIKDAYLSKKYGIDLYSVLFWDEVALSDNKSTNFQAFASNDAGSDAFLRLVRQIGKETLDVVKTVQDVTRIVKAERELLTSVVSVEGRHEIIISKFKFKIYSFVKKMLIKYNDFINEKITLIRNYKLKAKSKKLQKKIEQFDPKNPDEEVIKFFSQMKERYDLKASKVRKLINKVCNKLDYIFASGVIAYTGHLYFKADDVYKENLSSNRKLKFKLCFPIRYCYGSCDTYAYSIVGDYLQMRSIDFNNYVEDTNEYPDSIRKNRELFVSKIIMKDGVKNELKKKIKEDEKAKLNASQPNGNFDKF